MTGRYDGPVIDPHHHLWDLSLRRHPWLEKARGGGGEMVYGRGIGVRAGGSGQ